MALTAEQILALEQNEAFKQKCVVALVAMNYDFLADNRTTATEGELKRALRLVAEGDIARAYIDRIFKTLLGAPAIAASDVDATFGSDVSQEDLEAARPSAAQQTIFP